MSNLRFNRGPTNHQVSDHIFHDSYNNRYYQLLKPIGHWDYNNTTTVYQGILVPTQESGSRLINPRGAIVNIKACNKLLESQFYDLAREDASRSNHIRHASILPILGCFDDGNDKDVFFIVLPESPAINLRSLMISKDAFKHAGLPEDCITIALKSALVGLAHIHKKGEIHRQITGSCIVVYKIADDIRITFGGSAFVRTDVTHRPDHIYVPDPNVASTSQAVQVSEFLPYRDILKWGRAPEVVESDQEKYKTVGHTAKSDIWLIGITALEFAYGDIRILDRRDLLDIARCISVTRKMATTWGELLQQTEEFKIESLKPPKGKRQKMKEATVKFLTNRISKIVTIAKEKKQVVLGNKAIVKSEKGKQKEVGEERQEPFSKGFVKLVAKCLNDDPEKRPRAEKLLKCKFLKKAKPVQHLKDVVLRSSRRRLSQIPSNIR